MSVVHPHRQLIIDALRDFTAFSSVFEIGCNTGANLLRIRTEYNIEVAGIDVNELAIESAKQLLPESRLIVGNYQKLPRKQYDVVLSDAALIYAKPEDIFNISNEMHRLCKKGMILVERYSPSVRGEVVSNTWGRDYKALFENIGYRVTERSLTEEEWPDSPSWLKYGRLYICKK